MGKGLEIGSNILQDLELCDILNRASLGYTYTTFVDDIKFKTQELIMPMLVLRFLNGLVEN